MYSRHKENMYTYTQHDIFIKNIYKKNSMNANITFLRTKHMHLK